MVEKRSGRCLRPNVCQTYVDRKARARLLTASVLKCDTRAFGLCVFVASDEITLSQWHFPTLDIFSAI